MGFLDIKVPELLFNSLKKECKIALNSNEKISYPICFNYYKLLVLKLTGK